MRSSWDPPGPLARFYPQDERGAPDRTLVSCRRSCVRFGGVQVRASQGRRGRDTGRISTEENAARCVAGLRETVRDFADAALGGPTGAVSAGQDPDQRGGRPYGGRQDDGEREEEGASDGRARAVLR